MRISDEMKVEELVKMPEPDFTINWRGWGYTVTKPNVGNTDVYTADQLSAYSEAVVAAVAKRCAGICDEWDSAAGAKDGIMEAFNLKD